MKGLLILSTLIFIFSTAQGQFVIGEGVSLKIDNIVTTDGSLNNEGSLVWDTNSLLFLTGDGEILTKEGSIINNLKINGYYQWQGSTSISNNLNLIGGVLTPMNEARLLILKDATITSENEAHINGALYHQGTGEKFYPLGKNGIYTPVVLSNVQGDENVIVGIEAFNEHLEEESFQPWYWEVNYEGDFEGSTIQLPVLEEEGMSPVVLQSDGSASTSLGGTLIDDFSAVESDQLASGPFVFLGENGAAISNALLTIHNIVTPGRKDGKNDSFYIENIEHYQENTVILMDRWGTEVCRIENFRNDESAQKGCDLERISAGNYICVVEYEGKRSTPVLITILK